MNRKNFLNEIDLVDDNDQWRQMSEEQREAVMRDYEDGTPNADLQLFSDALALKKGTTLKKKKGFA